LEKNIIGPLDLNFFGIGNFDFLHKVTLVNLGI